MTDQTFTVPQLIGGVEKSAEEYFSVRDPGQLDDIVASVSSSSANDVESAVANARAAATVWASMSVHERADRLLKAADRLDKIKSHLADTLSREQGMLLRETTRDASNGAKALREAAAIGPDFMMGKELEDELTHLSVRHRPRGVVAAIVPWNAPMGLTMGKVGPALITGNVIIVKPSPFAPVAVTMALQQILDLFPAGVINVLNGDAAGPLLTAHNDVNKVSFTGSIETGVRVLKAASTSLKHVTLELGGNDPALILADADPAITVPGIFRQAMARSGQVCYAVKRVYVPRKDYQQWCDAFIAAADQLALGYGRDPESTLAPVNNRVQFDHVNQLAASAEASGARVHALGTKLPSAAAADGYYLPPRIVTQIKPDHPLVTGEQFGPILPLVPWDSEDGAIADCNATQYGLAASVWSKDEDHARACVNRIQSGVGFVNSHSRTPLGDRHMPFGGSKMSGLGRTRTDAGLREYVEPYALSTRKTNT